MKTIQGKCIPKLVEFGTMFDISEEHVYSFQTGPYLLLQDVGDIEPDCSKVEHFRLALESLQQIHNLGFVHRDIELRNLRFFDGRVVFFDFNVSKVSGNEKDFQKDIKDLQECFQQALQMKADSL
jgi:tRNA A-37 threonylcarbamoyl transferase component Bud32